MRTVASCLLVVFCACNDTTPVSPLHPEHMRARQFAMLDSSITLRAVYVTSSEPPAVILNTRIVLKTLADSAAFAHYYVYCNNFSKYDSLMLPSLRYDEPDTIWIADTLFNLKPLTRDLFVNLTFVGRTYVAQQESSSAWIHTFEGEVAWGNLTEPGLVPALYDSSVQIVPTIVWMKSGSGFYFTGLVGTVSSIYRFMIGGGTNERLSLPFSDPKLLDISSDDQTLLLTRYYSPDVYEYDVGSANLRLIIPITDSIGTGAASYSFDGSKIVLSTVRLDTQEWITRLYLWHRTDSSLQLIPNIGGVNVRRPVSWLPNSNDRFAVETGSLFVTFVTLSTGTMTTVPNLFPGYDWQLLQNGFGLAGLQMHRRIDPQENHVWLTDILGGEVQQLTFHPNYITSFSVSPDGTMLSFSGWRDNRIGIWILPLNGLLRGRLTSGSS